MFVRAQQTNPKSAITPTSSPLPGYLYNSYNPHTTHSIPGNTLTLEGVSPTTTILRVPEKLVLEVRATGQYDFIDWFRNGNIQGTGDFNPTIQQLPHFNEIYVKQETNVTDLGVYNVELLSLSGLTRPPRINFAVVAPGMSLVSFT